MPPEHQVGSSNLSGRTIPELSPAASHSRYSSLVRRRSDMIRPWEDLSCCSTHFHALQSSRLRRPSQPRGPAPRAASSIPRSASLRASVGCRLRHSSRNRQLTTPPPAPTPSPPQAPTSGTPPMPFILSGRRSPETRFSPPTSAFRIAAGEHNPHRKAILIFRQNLTPGSPYVDAAQHGVGLMALQYRPAEGATTDDIELPVEQAPRRLRLVKRGDTFTMELSMGSEPLHPVGTSIQLHLQEPFYVGIGLCSHDPDSCRKGRLLPRNHREAGTPSRHRSRSTAPCRPSTPTPISPVPSPSTPRRHTSKRPTGLATARR